MRKNIIFFTSSNIASLILTMLATLWCANLVGPKLMGIFNVLQLIILYLPIVTLGILNGLNREIPYAVGQGDTEAVVRLSGVAYFISLFVSYISAVLLLFIAFFNFSAGRVEWGWGFVAFAVVAPISLMRFFVEVTYRTGNDFQWLSIVKVLTSVLAIATVPLLLISAWEGLLFRTVLIAMFGFYLLWTKRKIISTPTWSVDSAKILLCTGLPIFLVGYLYTSLISLDRLVVSTKLGFEAIGLYTPSILILQGMAVLPSSVMQVIYPKAVELYSRTGSAKLILPLIFKPIPFLMLLQLPVALFLWIYLPDIIQFVMPKFIAGAEAAQWAVVAGSILALNSPALAFNVLKKQFYYGVIILLSGLVVYVSANYFISIDYGLASVAIATTLGFAVFVIVCSLVSYFICTGKSK